MNRQHSDKILQILKLPLFIFIFVILSGRFQHPDVLQLLSSLNKERDSHMSKKDEAKDSGNSQTTGGASSHSS